MTITEASTRASDHAVAYAVACEIKQRYPKRSNASFIADLIVKYIQEEDRK